jgi:c-di-GMP-binding flagellar brake protein YcgR
MTTEKHKILEPSRRVISRKERRRAERAEVHLKANVTLPGDLTLESHTIDISSTGVSCHVPYALEVRQSCLLEIDLKKFRAGRFEISAVVRSCQPAENGKHKVGLEFQNAPVEFMEKIVEIFEWRGGAKASTKQ